MFESEQPNAYEKVYRELVERLGKADLPGAAANLGLSLQNGGALVPLLGREYLVSGQGVSALDGGEAPFTHRIVLAWYLLHAGRGEPSLRFVPYRELPGGQDFARTLSGLVEDRAATSFTGRLDELKRAATALGAGEAPTEIRADAAFVVEALPKVPLMFTFYDADEDFPAEAKVFYDLTAPNFLDLECLAVLGQILVVRLEETAAR